jgi:cobyrinic acid a,c-diamide synthase
MFDRAITPRLVVAAASTGAGKTTIASALIRAMRERGKTVQPFTASYDRDDSALLSRVSHRQCCDLDPWMLGEPEARSLFCRIAGDADCAVIEDATATLNHPEARPAVAESTLTGGFGVARVLNSPVIIVMDLDAMGETVVASALGLKQLNPGVNFAGVVLNKARSMAAAGVIEDLLWKRVKLPVLGTVPILTDADNDPARHCDVDLIERLMTTAPAIATWIHEPHPDATAMPVNIAIAFDEAFSCYHAENLQLLESAGASITHFSPLDDHQLPRGIDAVYAGGSVSDTFIPALAKNRGLLNSLRLAHQRGVPMFLEAGGVVLGSRTVTTEDGREYEMAGILAEDLRFAPIRIDSDGRKISLSMDTLIGPRGTRLRGHEFGLTEPYPGSTTMQRAYFEYDMYDTPLGYGGWVTPTLTALPIQIHFAQRAGIAGHFVRTVRELAGRRLLAHSAANYNPSPVP